jgi:hypothetical protein
VWINGVSVARGDCCVEGAAGSVTLEAGRFYGIRIDHREQGGGAYLRLYWTPPDFAKQLVPRYALYPPVATPEPIYDVKVDTSTPVSRTPTGPLWDRRGEIMDNSASASVTFDDGDRSVSPRRDVPAWSASRRG